MEKVSFMGGKGFWGLLPRFGALFCLVAVSAVILPAQSVEDRIAALETRIRQLEQELVASKGGVREVHAADGDGARPFIRPAVLVSSSPSPVLGPAEVAESAAPAPPQQAPATADIATSSDFEGLNFFRGTRFSGFLDAYYNWNTNEPADMITTNGGTGLNRNFDFSHNSFTLSQVDFEITKAVGDTTPLGYMVQMTFGPTADFVNSPDLGGANKTAAHFMQYYLSGKVGRATLDFGKFVTPHGAEVIDNRANMNYSRGLLFALAIPYHHFGLRATVPVSDKVTFSGFLVNGWNNVIDNNKGKTVGLGLSLNPAGPISFIQNYMVGPEQSSNSDDVRHMFDSLLTIKLGDKVTFVANYDYMMDRISGSHVHAQGIAAYLKLQATPVFSITPRFEYYADPMGFTTGTAQRIREFTLTPEFIISKNLVTRFEYRHDWSTEPTFSVSGPDDDPKKQHTVGVGLILKF